MVSPRLTAASARRKRDGRPGFHSGSRLTGKDMTDKFREECGIFGIFGHPEAANLTYLGLYALQHRGQESVGISTSDGTRLRPVLCGESFVGALQLNASPEVLVAKS